MFDARYRQLLMQLWTIGPQSRIELSRAVGQTPNAVGARVRHMLEQRLVRELPAEPTQGAGRPQRPVAIDDDQRTVVGLALEGDEVTGRSFNLKGRPVGDPVTMGSRGSKSVAGTAIKVLRKTCSNDTIAVGVSARGFVDPSTATLLGTSDGTLRPAALSLSKLLEANPHMRFVLQNDMQAYAAAWRMTRGGGAAEDVLLIRLSDGAVGGALLINGRPNTGCVAGANEIGHTRLSVATAKCYCGRTGCLERVCSSDFLHRLGGRGSLAKRLSTDEAIDNPAVAELLNFVADGVANAANFVRPHRLVLLGPLVQNAAVAKHWETLIRARMLAPIRERLQFDIAGDELLEPVAAAAWLALGHLFTLDWPAVSAAPIQVID